MPLTQLQRWNKDSGSTVWDLVASGESDCNHLNMDGPATVINQNFKHAKKIKKPFGDPLLDLFNMDSVEQKETMKMLKSHAYFE